MTQIFQRNPFDIKREPAFIDEPGVTFRTRNRHRLLVLEGVGRPLCPDNSRKTELPTDDGRMAGSSSAIGHDGRRFFHDRFPVRISFVRDQHVSISKVLKVLDMGDHSNRALTDFLSHAPALNENLSPLGQMIGFHHIGIFSGLNRFGPGLDNEQLTRLSVLGPFDVHGTGSAFLPAVMVFNEATPSGQRQNFLIVHGKTVSVIGGDRHVFDHLASPDIINQFEFLASRNFMKNGLKPLLEGGLKDIILIRINGALHDIFPKPIGGVDQNDIRESRFRINREEHACCGQIGTHHLLHADRQRDLEMVEPFIDSIGNGPVGEQ